MGEAARVAAGGGAGGKPRADPPGIANSTVAKPSSSGTSAENTRSGVSTSSTAPITAPTIEAAATATNERSNGGNCERS